MISHSCFMQHTYTIDLIRKFSCVSFFLDVELSVPVMKDLVTGPWLKLKGHWVTRWIVCPDFSQIGKPFHHYS